MYIKETKKYKCDKCGRELNYIPKRIVMQEYGVGNYKQYSPVEHYDLCNRHYEIFINWIRNIKNG